MKEDDDTNEGEGESTQSQNSEGGEWCGRAESSWSRDDAHTQPSLSLEEAYGSYSALPMSSVKGGGSQAWHAVCVRRQ